MYVTECTDPIQCLKDICQTSTNHNDLHGKEHLASKFKTVVDQFKIDLSEPLKTFPGPFNPFFEACQTGNIPIIKIFLERGADLNVFDANGRTPLIMAIASRNNDHKVVSELLDLGAKLDNGSDQKNALLAAFYNMKRETIILLLKRGANINNTSLPAFCFVEAVFSLHANLVMMASGCRLQMASLTELVSLCTEIILAGLHHRTFFLTARRVMFEHFTMAELIALWNFQHLCLVLNFKVDNSSLESTIGEMQAMIKDEKESSNVKWMSERLDRLFWIKEFQSTPLPLTYLCRVSIRNHLSKPGIGAVGHIQEKVESLPLPRKCIDFLNVKAGNYADIKKHMTL